MGDIPGRTTSPSYRTDTTFEPTLGSGSQEKSTQLPIIRFKGLARAGNKTNGVICDANSPFLMNDNEDQGTIISGGISSLHAGETKAWASQETANANELAKNVTGSRRLREENEGEVPQEDQNMRRSRGRPRKQTKVVPSLSRDNETYSSSRPASPVSSLDGQTRPRRNAPRL
jgi:hypothetical protein